MGLRFYCLTSLIHYLECSDFGFEIAKVFELEVHFLTKMGSFMAQTQRKFSAFGKHTQCHCVNWVIVRNVNPAVKVGCLLVSLRSIIMRKRKLKNRGLVSLVLL
jgi:hypothetical protein